MTLSAIRQAMKGRWGLVAGLLALALVALVAIRWWRGPLVAASTVVRRDFIQSVVASGHVETPHRIDIGAQITGTVLRIPVEEGQDVRAGQALIELESAELRAIARQGAAAVGQAQARLRQLREVQGPVAEQTLRQAQSNLDNSRLLLARNVALLQRGFISTAALDESRKTVAVADAQMQTNRRQLEGTQAAGSDSALAVAALAEAQASERAAHARAGYAVISATVDGTLIGRNVEVGDVVQAGRILMTLSPRGRLQLVVEIDERNLGLLAPGQQAIASADAYPQQRFPAELAYINPGINAQTGAVEVKLAVPAPPAVLRQDMTVSVDIEVARRPNALLVPLSAISDTDSAAPWALRIEDGSAVRRPVSLGLRSGGFAEVISGLNEGDQIIPAAAKIAPGTRVRAITSTAPAFAAAR